MARDIVRVHPFRRVTIALLWEWRDLWWGIFIKKSWVEMGRRHRAVYVCVVPCLPLLISWNTRA